MAGVLHFSLGIQTLSLESRWRTKRGGSGHEPRSSVQQQRPPIDALPALQERIVLAVVAVQKHLSPVRKVSPVGGEVAPHEPRK